MRSLLNSLKDYLIDFIENKPTEKNTVSLYSNQMINTISKALEEEVPLHIIATSESFTGHLVKYDKEESLLILKDRSKNLSTMIPLNDVQKISILPASIQRDH